MYIFLIINNFIKRKYITCFSNRDFISIIGYYTRKHLLVSIQTEARTLNTYDITLQVGHYIHY